MPPPSMRRRRTRCPSIRSPTAPPMGRPGLPHWRRWPPGLQTPIEILGETRQGIVARGIDAPPVRCWPHHFDLDSLIALGAAPVRTAGLGFCPGDEYYDQPYFYVSSHPRPDVAALPHLPPVGHWHTHHFTAAVAVADRILAADDQRAATQAFLRAATDILVRPE